MVLEVIYIVRHGVCNDFDLDLDFVSLPTYPGRLTYPLSHIHTSILT